MKQKTSRGLCRRIQKNGSERKRICQSTPSANDLKKTQERLTGRSHPSGLKVQTGESGLVGAREPRWSPAAIHGKAGRSECTSVIKAPFHVCGRWWWSPASTTSTASFAPADGGSGGRVRLLVAREGNGRGLGAGGGLTGANRGGGRGGSGRPELRGKTSSGSP